jgi:hypothetical protein
VKKSIISISGAAAGVVLALALAGPASASAPSPADPANTPQLQAWLKDSTVSASPLAASTVASPLAASPLAAAAVAGTVKTAAPTGGYRITHTRGGALLWTANSFEWYYNSSALTSSTGWQTVGYIFPNTASKGGLTRTLKTSTQHNWRGTNNIGSGVVTPWGTVDVYHSTLTNYYTLLRAGKFTIG